MIGGTVVEYGMNPRNGVCDFVLYHCTTHGVTQEAVFDESGTDMLYYKITVRVTGIVHGSLSWTKYHRYQSSNSTGSDASFETRGLRASLDNRQTFRMRMGVTDDNDPNSGGELVYAEPWPDTAVPAPSGGMLHWDVNDGPKCELFGVEHVSDNNVFKVSATFTVCVVECDSANTGDPGTARNNKLGILSNRWSSSDDIDTNFLTTRTYSGRLRVASSKLNPHLLRAVVVPPVLTGFRRERMSFTASLDGKTLDWAVVDKEVVAAAPYPARTWDVSHSVDTDSAMLSMASCTIRLSGDRTSNARQMIAIAFFVIREKLFSKAPGRTITKRISVQTDVGEQNTVRVTCDVQSLPKKMNNVGVTIFASYENIGTPLSLATMPQPVAPYDPNISRGARAGEKIDIDGPVHLAGIFHARLQTPCDDVHDTDDRVTATSQTPSAWPPEQPTARTNPGGGPTVDVRIAYDGWSDSSAAEFSSGHSTSIYTSYYSESLYSTTGMRAAMPVAKSIVTSASGSQRTATTEDTAKIIRLGPAMSKRIVRVRADRVGEWPVLPTPVDYELTTYQLGQGDIPAGWARVNDVKFLPGTTETTPTGQKLYRAAVDIEYLLTRTVDTSQPLRVGNNPWQSDGLETTSGGLMFADETTKPNPGA